MSSLLTRQPDTQPAEDPRAALAQLFGYDRFQGSQEQVVSQVLGGIDTLAIMPTGAGKSLCYQLPAMMLPGVTLVISPLIALMKDQYDSLPGPVYEKTTFINSALDAEALARRMQEIVAGKYKLVYCAPERLRQQTFTHALRGAKLSMLVVDEAHCVSMWGHDFRPDYLFIGKCLPFFGNPTLLALTATATPQIREEISSQLGRDLKQVVASVFRPNLYYEVDNLDDKEQKLKRLLEICKSESGPGVVYARSRDDCEQLAGMLGRAGVKAAFYHAGMESEARSRTQEMFMLDRVRVIVATIAFGMGIDKANVRFIVHFSPPGSLEGYVQESGRAGRDGHPSRCVLMVTSGDRSNLTRWKRQEQLNVDQLRAVYKELANQIPTGRSGFVNMIALETALRENVGREFDSTQIRVSISLLERVGLIRRHPDAPRAANIIFRADGEPTQDADFKRFADIMGAAQGESTRREVAWLSQQMGVSPSNMDLLLLDWQEQGWIDYRGERRDPVIERLQAPSGVAAEIARFLEERDRVQQHQAEQIIGYASRDACRHRMLAAHLGEKIEDCGESCDYCNPDPDKVMPASSETEPLPANPGQVIVECLQSFPFNVGRPSLIKALSGSAASNITPDRVKHFGALAGASPSSIGRGIDELTEQGYIGFYESEQGFRLLEVTDKGSEGVMQDAISLKEKSPRKKGTRSREGRPDRRGATSQTDIQRAPTSEESAVFERLRAWRRATAIALSLPPYVIFHDKTLWAITHAMPNSLEQLASVKGIGLKQVEKYGEEILEMIRPEAGD